MSIPNNSILTGDALTWLRQLPDGTVNCCVTSPPYFGLRDYGHEGQIGLEETPDEHVQKLVEVFREVRRVLRDDGTLMNYLYNSGSGWHKHQGPTRRNNFSKRGPVHECLWTNYDINHFKPTLFS